MNPLPPAISWPSAELKEPEKEGFLEEVDWDLCWGAERGPMGSGRGTWQAHWKLGALLPSVGKPVCLDLHFLAPLEALPPLGFDFSIWETKPAALGGLRRPKLVTWG